MSALPTDNVERRLLSNSAKLLLLRRQPNAYKATNNADLLMENLAFINLQADASGDMLLSVSSLLIQELVDEIYSNNEPPQQTVIDRAITWHEQARRYVKQPKDSKIISSLVSKFPDDMRKDVESYLSQANNAVESLDANDGSREQEPIDIEHDYLGEFDSSEVLSSLDGLNCSDETGEGDIDQILVDDNDPWSDESVFDEFSLADESSACQEGSLSQMVGNEFYQLVPILDKALDANEAASGLANVVDELAVTSEEAGLDGLLLICQFLQKNINELYQLSADEIAVSRLLVSGFPDCLIAYLNQEGDDDLCLALIEYLAKPEWPRSLSYREEKDILYALTRQQGLVDDDGYTGVSAKNLDQSHVSLTISDDASTNLIDSFFAESDKHAEVLAAAVEQIGKGVEVNENIRTAQRLAHTLKGSANLLGVQGIANFAHYLEDIFDLLIIKSQIPCKGLAESMQDAADTIEVMIECLAAGESEPEGALATLQDLIAWTEDLVTPNQSPPDAIQQDQADEKQVTQDVPAFLSADKGLDRGNVSPAAGQSSDPIEEVVGQVDETIDRSEEVPEPVAASNGDDSAHTLTPALSSAGEVLRVPKQLIDNILNIVGEASISLGQMQSKLLALSSCGHSINLQDRTLQSKRFDLEELINVQGLSSQQRQQKAIGSGVTPANFDSLELDQYNEVYGATHSYIETVADSRVMAKEVIREIDELDTLFVQQQRLNRSLQDLVMSARMVAVSTVSARFQRAVRQAARMTGKDAELTIRGESLNIDSDLLNQLVDPIMHLLRNAVDHGIDSKERRFDSGKPELGQIQLTFLQDGNHLIVKCSDDGIGLNYDDILAKALAKGITQKVNLERSEVARLILSPGFSTRDEVTQVSGRGVGMDVVNAAVVNMKGSLIVGDNSEGQTGTLVEIRLPVALLTNHSIIVKSLVGQYAIPTNTLEQILTPGAGSLEMMGESLCYLQEKNIYPAITLASLLGVQDSDISLDERAQQNPVILINIDGQVLAVLIDSVTSALELVIKGFGPYVGDVDGIAGVSVLGNGDIIPVVDLPQLIRMHLRADSVAHQSHSLAADSQKELGSARAKVLIVDDSLSTRESLAELVRDSGHTPLLARDGMEALQLIEHSLPDLILTDLEMPKVNGLELVARVRSADKGNSVPIVMISSRSMQKHRDEAKKVGVNEYITKPYVPEDLMAIMGEQLSQTAISQ